MNFPELRDSTFSSHLSHNFLHTGNDFLVSQTPKFCVWKADSAVAHIPPRNSCMEHLNLWIKESKWIRKLWKVCAKGTLNFLVFLVCLVVKTFPLCYEFSSYLWELLPGSLPQCPQIPFFMDGAFLPWFLMLPLNHGWVLPFCCWI